MAKGKGGLNPEWRSNVTEPTGYHPIISARMFQHLTQEHKGATMDVNTGEFVDASDPTRDTYVVGQAPNTEGKSIPTEKFEGKDLGTPDIAHETYLPEIVSKFPEMRAAIRRQTGAREGASIGSWIKDDGNIDIDASEKEPDLGRAMDKAKVRNEKAIFSTKKLRESGYEDGDILNPHYKEPK